MNEKFNKIMPETTDQCLCVEIDRPISSEGYKENFIKRAELMAFRYGELRILVHYKKFSGWEEEAALMDISASNRFKNIPCKMALVNVPESEITRAYLMSPLENLKIKTFQKNELQDALEWIKS